MNRAHQRSIQMAKKSAQTARQNYQKAQNQFHATQRAMQQAGAVGTSRRQKSRGGFAALFGACFWGCCLGGLGLLFGGPIVAVIGALIGINIGPKIFG